MNRVQLLKDATRPVHRVVRHEAVPRVPVGGSAVTAERLVHISGTARAREALVQVVPFSGGAHPRMGKMMRLKEFEDAPPTACTEGARSGSPLDGPAAVRKIRADDDLLRAAALSREASLAMTEEAAEGYRRCARTT